LNKVPDLSDASSFNHSTLLSVLLAFGCVKQCFVFILCSHISGAPCLSPRSCGRVTFYVFPLLISITGWIRPCRPPRFSSPPWRPAALCFSYADPLVPRFASTCFLLSSPQSPRCDRSYSSRSPNPFYNRCFFPV